MYFVVVDLEQLHTRLFNSSNDHENVSPDDWLSAHGFRPIDNGWLASADAMNCLSCTEIMYSELADVPARVA